MKKLFFFLFLLLNISIFAQTYPVQIVAVMTPPHSSKIADYANPMGNRIHLQLITTDLSVQNRAITLHLEIKGNGISAVSSPLSTGIPNLRISGGEILSLTHSELAHYFQLRNLQGITTEQYASVLPDGVYSFCFRVKDATSGQWLSQNQCTMAYLMLNDPPLLNIPSDNEQVQVSDFQNILFSWTPRQINAVNVAYAFELREILDPNLDPKFAFEVSRKVHFEENLRTTTFVYDVSKPNLVPGRRYAWRIKAASTGGLVENSVFKNNGYSEIRSFVYAVNCSKPAFLLSQQQGKTSVKLLWQGNTSHQKYHIQYRKKGVENAQWFESFTRNTQTIIANLQSGAEYEFRVGASCEAERYGTTPSFVYADIQTFSIEKQEKSNENSYNCGIVPKIEITNQKPLASLIANEVFTAGDFPVQVLEAQGSNGIFSGKGFIKVPYLNDTKLSVSFENVKINTDNQLIEGVVKTTYDPSWGSVADPTEDIILLKNIIFNPKKGIFEISKKDKKEIIKKLSTQKNGSIIAKDENNKEYEINLTSDNQDIEVYALERGFSSTKNDTIANYQFTEKDIEFQKSLIEELRNDIKEKLNPNDFQNEERRYIQGALKHLDFLKQENVIFKPSIQVLSTGAYSGKLEISYPENASKDDIKITLFHEYLHHCNYMEKIFPYRYKDEGKRLIFFFADDCYSFEEPSMDNVLDDYVAHHILNTPNFNDVDWQYKKYNTLDLEEKKKIEEYKKENIYKYNQKECNKGQYKPSNYFQDEIAVYKICFSLNNIIFKMSPLKYKNYINSLSDYEALLSKSQKYEQKNDYTSAGLKK